jgi:hypothetical protein
MRRVLTAYLAFLMAAAPCLCCCTTGRLFAAAPAQNLRDEPGSSQAPCCCHDVTPEPQPAPAPSPSNPDPQERCPCREHAAKQALAAPADHDFGSRIVDCGFVVIPQSNISGPQSTNSPNADLVGRDSFLTATDLLHTHHRLRC